RVLHQMADAIDQVVRQRPAPAEQDQESQRRTREGAEMGPLLRTRGEREERADHEQAAKGEDYTGCTVQDGSHHLHLPAVNLEVGRQGTFANASGFGHERAVSLGWAAGPREEVK